MKFFALIAALGAALLTSACANDFTPYNQVEGLRVLAIRAEPPELQPGETTTLQALVTAEGTEQRWSWCPAPFAGDQSDQCPFTDRQIADLVRATGSDVDPPPLELGSGETMEYPHSLPPQLLAGICESFAEIDLPEGIEPPRCDGRFDVSIRLVVSDGETTVESLRTLSLIYADGLVANTNPHIDSGEISVRGAPPFPLAQSEPTTVVRDVLYKLNLDIDESNAEAFQELTPDGPVDTREDLVVTWFFEAGEMDKMRSSYLVEVGDFDNLRQNEFRTPTSEELETTQMRLYFVLRDNRGGLDWLISDLELVE
jgi:hypothetical protein